MFCCINHQKEHERSEHKEYSYILDKFPVICKKCHRCIYFIHDLHMSCHPYMNPHLMNGDFNHSAVSFAKSNRKRSLKDTEGLNSPVKCLTVANDQRKKLVPAYKFRQINFKKFITNTDTSQMLVIGFNQIIVDSKSVFSPQLNISYNMLAGSVLKSSTPLNEQEKENSPVTQSGLQLEKSVYSTPQIVHNSIVIISTKKSTSPVTISNFPKRLSKSILKNRKVTFEIDQTTETDNNASVYATPPTTMKVIEQFCESNDGLNMTNSPPACLLSKIVRRMRTAIHRIPRSISSWGWRNQKIKKSRSTEDEIDCEICSPMKKRMRYNSDEFLIRKPITSYWVNMSVNSMFRKPLPNYVQKYYDTVENHYQ